MMQHMKKYYLIALCLLSLSSLVAQKMPFQGRLIDGGAPFQGTATLNFSIPDASWSEEISGVSVQNGYYAVVLGEQTPLPATLFDENSEVSMSISVNGQALSPVKLYAPIVSNIKTGGSIKINNPNGKLRADLSLQTDTNDNKDEGILNLYGKNDSLNISIGSFDGYMGKVFAHDTLGRVLSALQGNGRFYGRSYDASGNMNAYVIGGRSYFGEGNAELRLFGQNKDQNGISRLLHLYTSHQDLESNEFSGAYRKAGIDIWDNEDRRLAVLTSNRDQSGSDPAGATGALFLNGTSTPNIEIMGQWWENHDLGFLQIFGKDKNASNENQANVQMGAGTNSDGFFSLFHTPNGSERVETVHISSGDAVSGGSLLVLKDLSNNDRVSLDGSDGSIASRRTDGGDAVYFYVTSNNGGIGVKNASDVNRFNFDAGTGILNLRNTSANTTVELNGNTGLVSAQILSSSDGTVQTSDRRLKKNITNLKNPLHKVSQMRGVSYQWKDKNKSQRNQVGVIAQEVEEIYPEFVHTDEKGMKSVNYAQMTSVLIEAIKELNTKVTLLEAENTELKASLSEVKTLRKEMGQLMRLLGGIKAASK